MKPQTLSPIRDRDIYSDLMAKKLEYELYDRIFRPILEIYGLRLARMPQVKRNAKERANARAQGLIEAIHAGKVVFLDGTFRGQFTAAISMEIRAMGGVFDKYTKVWKVSHPVKIPIEVVQAIAQAREAAHEKTEKALEHLDKLEKEGPIQIDLTEIATGIMGDLRGQFKRTTADKLEIPMAMEGPIGEELKKKYTENLNLYIKGWSDEAIVRLRGQVQESAVEGYRAARMEQKIRNEYNVSRNKARFLARQETSLLVSKYREENYKEAGVPAYRWSTSQDRRVRDDHKDLNGQIFRWDSPPIVDKAKGRRGHPGEDFGCRCVAIPILSSQLAKEMVEATA